MTHLTYEEVKALAKNIGLGFEADHFMRWYNSILTGDVKSPELDFFFTETKKKESDKRRFAKDNKNQQTLEDTEDDIDDDNDDDATPVKKRKRQATRERQAITDACGHQRALRFFKFAFESLGLTPEEACEYCSDAFIQKYKLVVPFECIKFPVELSVKNDMYKHIPFMVYPDIFRYENQKEFLWKREYNKLLMSNKKQVTLALSGDVDYDYDKIRFLFNMYVKYHPNKAFKSMEALYCFFASPAGGRYVEDAKLKRACDTLFDSPLELFYASQGKANRDNLLYEFAYFKENFDKENKKKRGA